MREIKAFVLEKDEDISKLSFQDLRMADLVILKQNEYAFEIVKGRYWSNGKYVFNEVVANVNPSDCCTHETFHYCGQTGTHCDKHCKCSCSPCTEDKDRVAQFQQLPREVQRAVLLLIEFKGK